MGAAEDDLGRGRRARPRPRPVFAAADAVVHLAWAIQPSRDEATLAQIDVEDSRQVVGAYSAGPKDEEVDESWPLAPAPGADLQGGGGEIRRLFVDPFLPGFVVRSSLVPALPRIAGLRFQAVHSADVARAYALAVLADASGAFNVAAEPPLDLDRLAGLLHARTFPVPTGLVRGLAYLAWRLRQWRRQRGEQLVKHLADVHSIEEQALMQMKAAPGMAGDERLAQVFERHREETEGQERRVRERLEAHDAAPSSVKDLAGKGGGYAMLLFGDHECQAPGRRAEQTGTPAGLAESSEPIQGRFRRAGRGVSPRSMLGGRA